MDTNESSARYVAIRLAANPSRDRDPVENCICVWANFRCEFNTVAEFVSEVIARRRNWEPLRALLVSTVGRREGGW